MSQAAIEALDTLALSPRLHSIGSASSVVLARHQLSAMTATALFSTATIFFTPPTLAVLNPASKLLSVPPFTGQALMAA